jgi:hypothetical protein
MPTLTEHTIGDAKSRARYTVEIENEGTGLSLYLPGFGTRDMEPGAGPVIFLEFENGEPILLVWADITTEEPTHKISLKRAAEELRIPD